MIGDVNKTESFSGFFDDFADRSKTPVYAVGVTFGADLEIWRKILGKIFDDFDPKNKFENALLITDKVDYADSSDKREFIKDNLNTCIYSVNGGYLHTKLVLIKYKDGSYKLAVPTKNIKGSGSYDIIMCFESYIDEDKKQPTHGEKLKRYLTHLNTGLESMLDGLEKMSFKPEKEGWTLDDIEFSYAKGRFSEKMWSGVLSCSLFISPFIDEQTVSELKAENAKLLSYQESIKKLSAQNTPQLYTGKFTKKGFEHFHAKLYVKRDGNKTAVYFGSANLTEAANNKHFEMLLKMTAPEKEYENIEGLFKPELELVQKYDPKLNDEASLEDDLRDDDPVINALSKVYISKDEKGFCLHAKDKSCHFPKAVFYPVIGDNMLTRRMVYICRENYDNDTAAQNGGLSFDEYAALAKKNAEKDREANDRRLILSVSAKAKNSRTSAASGSSPRTEPIPCFYSALYSRCAKSKKDVKDVLKDMLDECYTDEMIGFLKALCDKFN